MGLHCPFDPQEILENWLLESHFSLYGVIFLLFSFSIFRIKKNQQMHCSQILQQFLRSLACHLPVIFWFYMYPCCLISCSTFQSFTLLIEKGVTFLRKTYVHIVGVSLQKIRAMKSTVFNSVFMKTISEQKAKLYLISSYNDYEDINIEFE